MEKRFVVESYFDYIEVLDEIINTLNFNKIVVKYDLGEKEVEVKDLVDFLEDLYENEKVIDIKFCDEVIMHISESEVWVDVSGNYIDKLKELESFC
ncbi:MAG TPA: hypothetical protein VJB89_03990 [Candidatus Nanoarchaeia archaeon]|nr:hypothetical protein [Candidatus Nanoarchaeia archaeon]